VSGIEPVNLLLLEIISRYQIFGSFFEDVCRMSHIDEQNNKFEKGRIDTYKMYFMENQIQVVQIIR